MGDIVLDNNYKNKYHDEYDNEYKNHLITIKTKISDNKHVIVASFHIPSDVKNNEKLIELKNKINEDIYMIAKLYDCNGFVGLIKNKEYLTFETSQFGGDIWGVCNFTVKINDEIPKLLDILIKG